MKAACGEVNNVRFIKIHNYSWGLHDSEYDRFTMIPYQFKYLRNTSMLSPVKGRGRLPFGSEFDGRSSFILRLSFRDQLVEHVLSKVIPLENGGHRQNRKLDGTPVSPVL